MPRAQEGPTIKGGAVDPYTAGTLAAGKQQKESRILEAMRGQTQRDVAGMQMAQAGRATKSKERIAAMEMQAADRRQALSLQDAQENRDFQERLLGVQNEFTSEQSRIEREWKDARADKAFDQYERLAKEEQDLDRVQIWMNGLQNMMTRAQTYNLTKSALKSETARTKAMMAENNIAKSYRSDRGAFTTTIDSAADWSGPIVELDETPWSEKIFDDAATRWQLPVSSKILLSGDTAALEQLVADKKIGAGDVWRIGAVLDGVTKAYEDKKVTVSGKKGGMEQVRFLNSQLINLKNMRQAVRGLGRSSRRTVDDTMDTVGRIVSTGMKVWDDQHMGMDLTRVESLYQNDFEARFDDLYNQLDEQLVPMPQKMQKSLSPGALSIYNSMYEAMTMARRGPEQGNL